MPKKFHSSLDDVQLCGGSFIPSLVQKNNFYIPRKICAKNTFFSENKLTNSDASGFLRLYPNHLKVCIGNN